MYGKTSFYDILGVGKNVSAHDLLQAYRKAARNNTPGRGGSFEKFKEIAQAYRVLSDPMQRDLYHLYGVDVLKQATGHEDVSCQGGGRPRVLVQRTERDASFLLTVPLESLYNGTSQTLPFTRNAICSMCKGTGEAIDDKDHTCQQCMGAKVLSKIEDVDVHLRKGMQTGDEISVPGEDLVYVFTIEEEEHAMFHRGGDDLYVEHTLSFAEALCGFQFELTRLDNSKLTIKSEPGKVVKPGEYKTINGEGMPMYSDPKLRGNLYIRFTFDFPDSLTPEQTKVIEDFLPRVTPPIQTRTEQNGDHLLVEHSLCLTEALCGFQLKVTHLDQQLEINSEPGKVVKPGCLIYEMPSVRGKVVVHCTVEFPDNLTPEQSRAIKTALTPGASPQLTEGGNSNNP